MLKDIRVHAIKIGTLFNSETTRAVAAGLRAHFKAHGPVPFVCDSIYVSDYGVVLSGEDVRTIVKELFPLAHVVTLSEADAQYLLNIGGQPSRITSLDDMLVAAKNILAVGVQAVLLKGGQTVVSVDDIRSVKARNDTVIDVKSDFPLGENIEILGISGSTETKDHVVDVLCRASITEPGAFAITLYPRLCFTSKNVQGVNAPFSAALACALGNGSEGKCFLRTSMPRSPTHTLTVEEAAAQASTFTRLGVETAMSFGKDGNSPTLNHLHSTSRLVVHP